jgi:hypothetical protein
MRWLRRSHDLFRRASEAQMRKAKFELPPIPVVPLISSSRRWGADLS